jgi:hypothetical protein
LPNVARACAALRNRTSPHNEGGQPVEQAGRFRSRFGWQLIRVGDAGTKGKAQCDPCDPHLIRGGGHRQAQRRRTS